MKFLTLIGLIALSLNVHAFDQTSRMAGETTRDCVDRVLNSYSPEEAALISEREQLKSAGTDYSTKPSARASKIAQAAAISMKLMAMDAQLVYTLKHSCGTQF